MYLCKLAHNPGLPINTRINFQWYFPLSNTLIQISKINEMNYAMNAYWSCIVEPAHCRKQDTEETAQSLIWDIAFEKI